MFIFAVSDKDSGIGKVDSCYFPFFEGNGRQELRERILRRFFFLVIYRFVDLTIEQARFLYYLHIDVNMIYILYLCYKYVQGGRDVFFKFHLQESRFSKLNLHVTKSLGTQFFIIFIISVALNLKKLRQT